MLRVGLPRTSQAPCPATLEYLRVAVEGLPGEGALQWLPLHPVVLARQPHGLCPPQAARVPPQLAPRPLPAAVGLPRAGPPLHPRRGAGHDLLIAELRGRGQCARERLVRLSRQSLTIGHLGTTPRGTWPCWGTWHRGGLETTPGYPHLLCSHSGHGSTQGGAARQEECMRRVNKDTAKIQLLV